MDLMMHGIRLKENKHKEKNMVKSHYHEVYQILYVLENKGVIGLNQKSYPFSYPFSEDYLAFIPPFSDHAIASNEKMTVHVLKFDLEKLDFQLHDIIEEYSFNQAHLLELNIFEAYENSLNKR